MKVLPRCEIKFPSKYPLIKFPYKSLQFVNSMMHLKISVIEARDLAYKLTQL